MPAQRVRRSPEDARLLILEAAERLLVEGGANAVQVRAVAQRVGMTDAGIAHHFGNRDGLLVALVRYGGHRLRNAVEQTTRSWAEDGASVAALIDCIADVYEDGYGELAIALHAAGWRDEGSGMLEPVVDALHRARNRSGGQPRKHETRLAVAALHQALATQPVYGDAFRRSAGLDSALGDRQQRKWWVDTLTTVLQLD